MRGAKKFTNPFASPNSEANPSQQGSLPTSSLSSAQEIRTHHQPAPAVSSSSSAPGGSDGNVNTEKWGTHVMGTPAVPTSHPDNKKAALWGASASDDDRQQKPQYYNHPYVQYSPVQKSSRSTKESILNVVNTLSKAETVANNVWHNLKTSSSVTGAAWGKVNLSTKRLTEGGCEALYKQTFTTYPNEHLKKRFACYLSTTTGPVPGTLYLSNVHVAFCSDRTLSCTAPSGQETWSYYKVMVPLPMIVEMRENQSEKYIQIVTVDGNDFWFMGFVNYEKASQHLSESISNIVAPGVSVNQS